MDKAQLIDELFRVNAIKLGQFTLASGRQSSIYIDLRVIVSYPQLLQQIAMLMWQCASPVTAELLCGVPYTALPIATCMAVVHDKPMLILRKEKKDYGTKKMLEGVYTSGQNCLVIEDVITSGGSVLKTTQQLKAEGLTVTDVVLLVDRCQGGKKAIQEAGYRVHAVVTLAEILTHLKQQDYLNAAEQQALAAIDLVKV